MTHLKIEQNGIIEDVSVAILNKIYELSQQTLDNSSSLRGELRVPKYYRTKAQEIQERWNNLLHVTASEWYIDFADSTVELICATNWGDGNGITESQVRAVSTLGSNFRDNASITSFNELEYFTNVKTLGEFTFRSCSALESIDLKNVTNLGQFAFWNCTSLSSLGDTLSLLGIGNQAFLYCSSLEGTLSFPSLTGLSINNYGGWFASCSKVEKIVLGHPDWVCSGSNYIKHERCGFGNCSRLRTVDLGDSVERYGSVNFSGNSSMEALIIRSLTPPKGAQPNGALLPDADVPAWFADANSAIGGSGVTIFVPDSVVNVYKADVLWGLFSSNIKPISEYEANVALGTMI